MHDNNSEPLDLILLQKFYTQIPSKADTIFAESVKKVLSLFGESIRDNLVLDVRRSYNISEIEFFTNYDLVKKSLISLIGDKASKIVLDEIRNEISIRINDYSKSTIEDLLERIKLNDVITFLKNLKGHEHILFLWKNQVNAHMILLEYISSKNTSKIYFSRVKKPIECVSVIFDDLFVNKDPINIEIELINKIHLSNNSKQPTLIVADDCTAWFESKYKERFIQFEETLNRYFEKNYAIGICGFDMKNMNNIDFMKILPCFHYVIHESPWSIHKHGNNDAE